MLPAVPALGRTYYLSLPQNLSTLETEATILNLVKLLQENKKIRILWDDPLLEPVIKTSLEKIKSNELPTLSIQDYQTVFYFLKREEIATNQNSYSNVNWQNYPEFEYQTIQQNSPSYSVVENFFLNSNGTSFSKDSSGKTVYQADNNMQAEILKQLPTALTNPANKVFLVSKRQPLEYVGAFSLLKVNPSEIQLHYTSGKSDLTNVYAGKKMPILMAAMLDIFQNDLDYSSVDLLTFSNKDEVVGKLYKELGFKPHHNRKCLIVKNNLHTSDLK